MDDLLSWLRTTIERVHGDVSLIQGGGGIPTPEWTTSLSRSGSWRILHATDDHTPLGYISVGRNEHIHITRYDPRATLAQLEAHVRILDEVVPQIDEMDDQIEREWGSTGGDVGGHEASDLLVKLIGLHYQGEPGYRDEWRPEGGPLRNPGEWAVREDVELEDSNQWPGGRSRYWDASITHAEFRRQLRNVRVVPRG